LPGMWLSLQMTKLTVCEDFLFLPVIIIVILKMEAAWHHNGTLPYHCTVSQPKRPLLKSSSLFEARISHYLTRWHMNILLKGVSSTSVQHVSVREHIVQFWTLK
jgi:hypothetical protein